MTRIRRDINSFLQQVRLAVTNAQQVPAISTALARYGFDAIRIEEGVAQLTTAELLQAAQVKEYGSQYQATTALKEAHAAADKRYGLDRRLARLALHDDPETQKALLLHERRSKALDSWLGQAGVFYKNALSDPDVMAALAQYNITVEKLTEGQTAVNAVATLNAAQEKKKSDAQKATKQRDAALDALEDWYIEFRELSRIALMDDPQYLEALGLGSVA